MHLTIYIPSSGVRERVGIPECHRGHFEFPFEGGTEIRRIAEVQ